MSEKLGGQAHLRPIFESFLLKVTSLAPARPELFRSRSAPMPIASAPWASKRYLFSSSTFEASRARVRHILAIEFSRAFNVPTFLECGSDEMRDLRVPAGAWR